jgi:hypothetical protein
LGQVKSVDFQHGDEALGVRGQVRA